MLEPSQLSAEEQQVLQTLEKELQLVQEQLGLALQHRQDSQEQLQIIENRLNTIDNELQHNQETELENEDKSQHAETQLQSNTNRMQQIDEQLLTSEGKLQISIEQRQVVEEQLNTVIEQLQASDNQQKFDEQKVEILKNQIENFESGVSVQEIQAVESSKDVIITIIRQKDGARETDVCLGTALDVGYLTSYSCCQANEIFLFDLNNTEIHLITNSYWADQNLCFFKTTESEVVEVDFSPVEAAMTEMCSLLMFDHGELRKHELEISVKDCFAESCLLNINSNLKIINGTAIYCSDSSNLGIVIKSE